MNTRKKIAEAIKRNFGDIFQENTLYGAVDELEYIVHQDKQAILSLIPEQRELMYDGDDDYNQAIREMTTALEKYFEEVK